MKISVITVSLNRAGQLESTLKSVLGQIGVDVEFVVVDGASSDNTVQVLEEYGTRFGGRLRWVSEPDNGIYNAMNKGLALASGDALGFLGAGDTFYDERSLYNIADTLERTGVDAVYGDLILVSPSDRTRICRSWRGSQYVPGIFNSGWQPAHPTFFVRRNCFGNFGDFDETLDISADFDLMFRFLEKHRISNRYIPMTLVRMLNGGESNGSFKNIMVSHRNIRRSFRKYGYNVPVLYSFRRLAPKILNMMESYLSSGLH